ncbi:MAG: protein kinase [Deltaproteobacteria bacterium]|nr:protein kinase [Deltaproteobacteria bacterium]
MTREPHDSTVDLPVLASADALEVVQGYTLVRMVAEGTSARVYECRSERLGGFVVVKVLQRPIAQDRGAKERLLRESRLIAGLRNHPNVVRVLDVGEAGAGPYVVQEKIEGETLRARLLGAGRLPVLEALTSVRDAAKGLDAAATIGVVHRDVKPSNLFRCTDGAVKVADYGFAAPLSLVGGPEGVFGTPAFLAPELIKGAPADVRSDIYALGATLWQLLTARPLFEGTSADVLAAHGRKPIPSIATMVPEAGIVVVDILYRFLQKEPARRPQSWADAISVLDDGIARTRRSSSVAPALSGPAASEPQWPTRASGGVVELPPLPPPPSSSPLSKPPPTGSRPPGPTRQPTSPFEQPSTEAEPYVAQPTGVMGTLKQMGVVEIVQMLEIGKKSARLDFQGVEGWVGQIFVHDGQIVRCTLDQQAGEAAVCALCRKKEGFFRIHYEKERCERNVSRPTTLVLLEAMRTIDETGAEAPAPAAPARPAAASAESTVRASPVPQVTQPPARPVPHAARSPLARPLTPDPTITTEPPRPVSGLGDGISRDDAPRGAVDDPTLPEVRQVQVHSVTDVANAPDRPPAVGIGEELFGATARGNVTSGAKAAGRAISDVARNLAATVAFHAPRVWAASNRALAPLSPMFGRMHPALRAAPPAALVAGALALVVALMLLVVALVSGGGGGPSYVDAVQAIAQGEAAEVAEELAALDPVARSAEQELALGHALVVLGDDAAALAAYHEAVPAGVTDVLLQGWLLSRLDASQPDDELDLLVLWPENDIEEALAPMAMSVSPLVRQNAVGVLAERSALALVDLEAMATLDLYDARVCGERRAALTILRYAGKSTATLTAIDSVGRKASDCFRPDELARAYKAVAARIPKAPK